MFLENLKKHLPWLAIIVFVSLFLTRNIWDTRAWNETHDGIFHVIRADEMFEMLKEGQFPVRWAGTLDNGFGLPIFNYVYPLPYYLTSPLMAVGLSAKWAVKFVEVATFLLGGLGFYAFFAGKSKKLATVVALLYLTTPYLLLNVFVRGALGEFLAMSLIPWVLVAHQDLVNKDKLRWYHPIPLALLFLSHNFLSFLFLPIYLSFVIKANKAIIYSLLGLGLSLALAAFFILPMALERDLIASASTGNFTYSYADHFIYPQQLLFSDWQNGHSVSGTDDGMSFQLGIPHIIVFLLGLITIVVNKKLRGNLWLPVLIFSVLVFLTTPLAATFWQFLLPLQIIQFPWRLLALSAITLPIIAFYVLDKISKRYLPFLIGGLLLVSMAFAVKYSKPHIFQSIEQFQLQFNIHRNKTSTSSRRELLPLWSSFEEQWKGDEEIRVLKGAAEIGVIKNTPTTMEISSVTSDPDTLYQIRRNYFPAWQAKDQEGRLVTLIPSDEGEIILKPEQGKHTYRLEVRNTLTETLGNLTTVVTIAAIVGVEVWHKRPRKNKLTQ